MTDWKLFLFLTGFLILSLILASLLFGQVVVSGRSPSAQEIQQAEKAQREAENASTEMNTAQRCLRMRELQLRLVQVGREIPAELVEAEKLCQGN